MLTSGINASLSISGQLGDKTIEKQVHIGSGDVLRAQDDLVLYADALRGAGLRLPATEVLTSCAGGASTVLVRMDFIEGITAYDALAAASTPDRIGEVTVGIAREIFKITETMYGHRPIGYDTALRNFVISAKDQALYCIDLTPPRLMFSLDASGVEQPLPYPDLLINYPGCHALSPEYEATLRRFYYTPEGTCEHMFAWCVTAATSDDTDALRVWKHHRSTGVMLDAIEEGLATSARGRALASSLRERVSTGELDAFMERRILKASNEPRISQLILPPIPRIGDGGTVV